MNTEHDALCKSKLGNFLQSNQNAVFNHHLSLSQIEDVVQKLPNDKCIGFAGVSNEMIKYDMMLYADDIPL